MKSPSIIGRGLTQQPEKSHAAVTRLPWKSGPSNFFSQLQQSAGNSAAGYLIQTKLTINQPRDTYEQEAEQVADKVMSMSRPQTLPHATTTTAASSIQRQCACEGAACPKCEKEKKGVVQRRTGGSSDPAGMSVTDGLLNKLDHGQPLDDTTRSFFEPRFNQDFSSVRVHTNPQAAATATAINALAYTYRNNVVFAASQYAPNTVSGQHLLAHELTHVVQQTAAPSAGIGSTTQVPGSGSFLQRAINPTMAKIEDLLSYGFFDWAITDKEALGALQLLKQLSKYDQAVFLSEEKYSSRLRENLPDDRIPEFDKIAASVADILPPASAVDDIESDLSYGLFDWAVTDADAIDALEKLKKLPANQLAVVMGNLNYGRLLDNLPDSRKQELSNLVEQSLGTGGAKQKEEESHPGTILSKISFKSDHGVMKDNDNDWSASGLPFGEPEWFINSKNEEVSRPISHTMDRSINLEVGLNVSPITAPTAPITLRGESDVPFLNFDFSGSMRGGLGQVVLLTSTGKIPQEIVAYKDKQIRWKMKWQNWEHEIARTNHTVFSTMADPAEPYEVTLRRMALAVGIIEPFHSLDPHTIVRRIMAKWNSYNLAIYYENPWELADNLAEGAQCITIVRFIKGLIETVGCPGIAQAVVISANPSAAAIPVEEVCPACPGLHAVGTHPIHNDWFAGLLDGDWHSNAFEAALKFEYGGVLKYYPGGVSSVLSTPEQVLHVFKCLAWIKATGGQRCQIMEVPPGGDYPFGPCPVGSEHTCFVR